MQDQSGIEHIVKDYVLREFLPGEDPSQLTTTTPLITTGILDSLATLKIVAFLETEFAISLSALLALLALTLHTRSRGAARTRADAAESRAAVSNPRLL